MTEEFDLYHVLAVTHRLPSLAGDYRRILEFVSGQSIPAPSHALGIADTCKRWILEQHPRLREVPPCPPFGDNELAMDAWADEQKQRLGVPALPLRPLPEERRRAIPDYVERLLDHVDPQKVYVHDPEDR